jgi:hypothetical protein
MPEGWIDYGLGAPEDFGPAVADSKNAQTGGTPGTDEEDGGAVDAVSKAAGCQADARSAAMLPTMVLGLILGAAFFAIRRPARRRI